MREMAGIVRSVQGRDGTWNYPETAYSQGMIQAGAWKMKCVAAFADFPSEPVQFREPPERCTCTPPTTA